MSDVTLEEFIQDLSEEDKAELAKARAELQAMPLDVVISMVRGVFVNIGSTESI
jgi:hypothetical protein